MNILIFCAVASTSAFGQFGTPTEPANPVAKAPRIHSLPLPTEADVVIPCHYDLFEFNTVSPAEFGDGCARLMLLEGLDDLFFGMSCFHG